MLRKGIRPRATALAAVLGLVAAPLSVSAKPKSKTRVAVMPLIPKQGAAPKRILVQVTKGQDGPISENNGLILHEDGRNYTNVAEAILRHAQPLHM